jgi:ketosteroid isomerase-like protein
MNQHERLIQKFYTAFEQGDFKTMQSCYHDNAVFSDPVFQNLNSREVKAMWEMLLTSANDLKVTFDNIKADASSGSASWEAWYTFSRTGRSVHNVITAEFQFDDGKIIRHKDHFDLWQWSRQALGMSGLFLGWSSIVVNKVRGTARKSLDKFLASR